MSSVRIERSEVCEGRQVFTKVYATFDNGVTITIVDSNVNPDKVEVGVVDERTGRYVTDDFFVQCRGKNHADDFTEVDASEIVSLMGAVEKWEPYSLEAWFSEGKGN